MRIVALVLLLSTAAVSVAQTDAAGARNGEILPLPDGAFLAWDAETRTWLSPGKFWDNFANRGRGKRWPDGDEYPPYADVSEHDTFLIITERGPCLMYFFHTRWRRANDVWRWGEAFNAFGGCPYVFD